MINNTSEGNLFTSFCTSVAGTASFQHLTVTALFQFFIQSVLFELVNFNLFASLLVLFVVSIIFVTGVCNSGIETHQVDCIGLVLNLTQLVKLVYQLIPWIPYLRNNRTNQEPQ